MKLALVYYLNMDFGGAERRLTRIYNELGKQYRCDLLVRGCNKNDFIKRLEKADCAYDYFDKVVCFSSNIDCISHIVKEKYEYVHFFDTSKFNVILMIVSLVLRRNTIFTIASVSIAERIRDSNHDIKDKVLIRLSTVVDVLYPWCQQYIEKERKGKKTNTTVGTFTDLQCFMPKEKHKILVYAAARLEEIKNPKLLIEACNLSKEYIRAVGYKVLLLGKGILENQVKEQISYYGIDDIVIMLGYKKTSDIFPEAEAVFSLQRNENYPSQVIAEACASGCYLFITDVGSSRNCASEEFCSFVRADANILSKAIEDYIKLTDEDKKKCLEKARDYALTNYSIENSIKYYKSLI